VCGAALRGSYRLPIPAFVTKRFTMSKLGLYATTGCSSCSFMKAMLLALMYCSLGTSWGTKQIHGAEQKIVHLLQATSLVSCPISLECCPASRFALWRHAA